MHNLNAQFSCTMPRQSRKHKPEEGLCLISWNDVSQLSLLYLSLPIILNITPQSFSQQNTYHKPAEFLSYVHLFPFHPAFTEAKAKEKKRVGVKKPPNLTQWKQPRCYLQSNGVRLLDRNDICYEYP